MDQLLFQTALEKVAAGGGRSRGIGTLGEKSIHAVLKYCYEPFGDGQEVRLGGYVADAVGEDGIFEIQTGNFQNLRGKLNVFLPVCRVTVVYPAVVRKRLNWIDPISGSVQQGKFFRCGTRYSFFAELYRIKNYLQEKNLHFRIVELTAEEFRILNGSGARKKIRAEKCDRIPRELLSEIILETRADFAQLLPENLPPFFGSAEFSACAKIPRPLARTALNILTDTGVIERREKRGRSYVYSIACNSSAETVK